MTSLEKLSEQCVSVCEVAISVPKETVLQHVTSVLRHGRIVDSDQIDGIESDKNLTRLVLLLTAVQDVELLCEMKQDEIQAKEKNFIVRYKKAIASELPERWEEIEIPGTVERQSLLYEVHGEKRDMPPQPGEGGKVPTGGPQSDQPAGPTPHYNSEEFKNQEDHDDVVKFIGLEKERYRELEPDPEEWPTKIVVSNLPSTVHEEYLEMFFENTKRFGGGTVIAVDFDEESSSAVVEIEEPKAVDVVMGKCPIKMMGQVVEVEVFKPEEPVLTCTIQVTGPCSIICEEQIDALELYFESNKRSGGGDIVDIKFDHENNWVLVTFEEEEIAQRVVERPSHVYKKESLIVKLHVPTKASKMSDKIEKAKTEEKQQEPVRTVKVKGVDKTVSRDTVEVYFENARRSGGGVIEEIRSDEEEDDVLFITFVRPEDAVKVCSREHKVEGKKLTAVLYEPPKPPPCYENKVLINGLKPSTTKDCLFLFLEAKSGCMPESLDYHSEQDGVVMVTFENEIDVDVLKKIFAKYKLEEATLKASPVPISNCILVANLAPDVTKDTVRFYFENERRSGGGPTNKVIMNEDDTCLVYFTEYTIIERVLRRKHTLNGQELNVRLYQDSLGRPEGEVTERKLLIPEPIVLKYVDPQKIKLLDYSKENREALEVQLNDCFTSVQWSEEKGEVTLECTLTNSTKDCFKLAKSWKEDAVKNFNDYMKNIIVSKVSVSKEIWFKVMEELKSLNINDPRAVAIFVSRKEGDITVVGLIEVAESLSKKIEEIIQKAFNEVEKEREKIKEVFTCLKHIETRLLLADKFPAKMEEQFSDLKVKINQHKNEIVFEGPIGQVVNAKLMLYEAKIKFSYKTTGKLPVLSAGLYLLKQTKDHIRKNLKEKHVTAVWDIEEGCLVVYSTSEDNIQECVDIVRGSVIENTITLKNASKSLVYSEKLQAKLHELHALHAGKCHIRVSEECTKVYICATDDIAADILKCVKRFLLIIT